MGYIYSIHCTVNNKIYIGSTTRKASVRKSEHFYLLRKGVHTNKHLQHSWNKYGECKFSFNIIENCPKEECFVRERYHVEINKCYKKENGYNKSKVVDAPNRGKIMTSEQKQKISKSLMGRVSPMKGKKNPIGKINAKVANRALWKRVIDLNNGIIYDNVKKFCNAVNISPPTFYRYIDTGTYKNIKFKYYREL